MLQEAEGLTRGKRPQQVMTADNNSEIAKCHNADDRSQNRSAQAAQLSAAKAESRWTRGSLHGPFSLSSCHTKHFPASGSSRVQPSTPHLDKSSFVYTQLSFMACELSVLEAALS
ncbi:hypothetical protein KCU62_g365, partial [Aureobasidium sp. EXF-3399]